MKSPYTLTNEEHALLHAKGFVKLQGHVGDFWKLQDLRRYDTATQIGEICELIICVYLKNGVKIFQAHRYQTQATNESHKCRKSAHQGVASQGLEAFLNKHLKTP